MQALHDRVLVVLASKWTHRMRNASPAVISTPYKVVFPILAVGGCFTLSPLGHLSLVLSMLFGTRVGLPTPPNAVNKVRPGRRGLNPGARGWQNTTSIGCGR